MGKVEFKEFVRRNPNLNEFVINGSMTWQSFYEMYDMYGENSEVWNQYKKLPAINNAPSETSVGDVLNFLRNINLDELSNTLTKVEKIMTSFSGFTEKKKPYEPRPLYQKFED